MSVTLLHCCMMSHEGYPYHKPWMFHNVLDQQSRHVAIIRSISHYQPDGVFMFTRTSAHHSTPWDRLTSRRRCARPSHRWIEAPASTSTSSSTFWTGFTPMRSWFSTAFSRSTPLGHDINGVGFWKDHPEPHGITVTMIMVAHHCVEHCIASNRLTTNRKKLWKITMLHGKIHYKWSFSIAILT